MLNMLICYFDGIWTISEGSGGGSYTVGRVESESGLRFQGKPREIRKTRQNETITI